jgi:hypothetical protein
MVKRLRRQEVHLLTSWSTERLREFPANCPRCIPHRGGYWYVLRLQRLCRYAVAWRRLRGHVTLRATSPQYGRKTGAILVKVDKTDSRGQHVPSSMPSILSIPSIAACGDNNEQWLTDHMLAMHTAQGLRQALAFSLLSANNLY